MIWFWASALVLDFSHTIAPMALVCVHPGLRSIAKRRWRRCILTPSVVFGITAAIAAVTALGLTGYDLRAPHQLWRLTGPDNPLPVLVWVYWSWNAYHFGMQNFGLARLLRCPGSRFLHKAIFGGGTAAVMLGGSYLFTPLIGFVIGVLLTSFGHWLTEIGLCWRVSGYRVLFLVTVLSVGCCAFCWSRPTAHGLAVTFLALYVCRLGLGFVHFQTDRWIWKLSDPEVRAVIGPRLGLASTYRSSPQPVAVLAH